MPDDFQPEPLTLDRNTLAEIGAVASRGFYDDPFFQFLWPQPMLRARGIGLFMRGAVGALGERAVATGVRDKAGNLLGVSVWQKPGTRPLPVTDQIKQMGGGLRALVVRPRGLIDGARYLLAVEKAHLHDEHWYLLLLVTDPTVWRRGVGTALLNPRLEVADEDGLPCYLETQKYDNIAYYRRFGFDLADTLMPVSDGPPLYTMVRPAR